MSTVPRVEIIDLLTITDDTALVVNATGVVYMGSFPLKKDASYALRCQFSSGGTISVLLQLEQGAAAPGTEKSADTDWAVGENAGGTAYNISDDVADANVHILPVSPVVTPYARVKLTGQGANAADTQIDVAELLVAESN